MGPGASALTSSPKQVSHDTWEKQGGWPKGLWGARLLKHRCNRNWTTKVVTGRLMKEAPPKPTRTSRYPHLSEGKTTRPWEARAIVSHSWALNKGVRGAVENPSVKLINGPPYLQFGTCGFHSRRWYSTNSYHGKTLVLRGPKQFKTALVQGSTGIIRSSLFPSL